MHHINTLCHFLQLMMKFKIRSTIQHFFQSVVFSCCRSQSLCQTRQMLPLHSPTMVKRHPSRSQRTSSVTMNRWIKTKRRRKRPRLCPLRFVRYYLDFSSVFITLLLPPAATLLLSGVGDDRRASEAVYSLGIPSSSRVRLSQ